MLIGHVGKDPEIHYVDAGAEAVVGCVFGVNNSMLLPQISVT